MRRRAVRLGAWAGVVLIAFVSFALADDLADETKRLEGTWTFLSLTSDGEEAPQEVLSKASWTFRGKEIVIPGPAAGKASFTLDPSQTPKAIDMTAIEGPGKGKTLKAIYKLEGDRLTICVPEGRGESKDKSRPAEFDGGKGRSLIVLKRKP